jgi:hypothetical protein
MLPGEIPEMQQLVIFGLVLISVAIGVLLALIADRWQR